MTTWCSEPKPRDKQGWKSLCSQRRGSNCLVAARSDLRRPLSRRFQQREPRNGVLVSLRAKRHAGALAFTDDRVTGRSVPYSVQFSKTACPWAHRRTAGFGGRDTHRLCLGGSWIPAPDHAVGLSIVRPTGDSVNGPPLPLSSAQTLRRADSGSAVEVYPATLGCQPVLRTPRSVVCAAPTWASRSPLHEPARGARRAQPAATQPGMPTITPWLLADLPTLRCRPWSRASGATSEATGSPSSETPPCSIRRRASDLVRPNQRSMTLGR